MARAPKRTEPNKRKHGLDEEFYGTPNRIPTGVAALKGRRRRTA